MAEQYSFLGQPTPRLEGVEKVTGQAMFVADRRLPDMAYGRLLHSSRPHARIVSIDTSQARSLPGVLAVLTGEDVRGPLYGRRIRDIPVLADGVVRFFGERVAAVAADDPETAKRAIDLIDVQYEDLPAVFSIEDAMADGAPVLHPDFSSYPGARPLETPSNAYFRTETERGNVAAGFAEADVIVERTYRTQRVHQVYLEPHASIVSAGERVEVWTNTKAPYAIRESLAATIGRPEDDIVLNHSYIGGDFGGKGTPLDLPIAYHLSLATGRPVRLVADYIEEFMAGEPRHSTMIRLKTGVKRDGTLTAHEVSFFVNCGAYAGYKPAGVIGGSNTAAGPYRVPNCRIEATQVYTNTVPGGHMRAPGAPQGVFALESHMDVVAREVGMDPVEFRLKNLIADGDETAYGEHFQGVRVRETLQAATDEAAYWSEKPRFTGRGVAVGDHSAGGGQGNAAVTFNTDGSITLGTPIFDQGSGTYTTLQQVVAEELQVSRERIQLEVWNTDVVPFDSGIGGSRATRVNTVVAREAAVDARNSMLDFASNRLERPAEDLSIHDDQIIIKGEDQPVRWTDLLTDSLEPVMGRAQVEQTGQSHITGFAAQVAEVSVDPETGEVELLSFTSAHDVGRVLNPIGHQGQINGGFVQGLGFALMEELVVEEGQVTSVSFADYKIPSIRDLPPLKTVLVPSDYGVGPYLVKGIGENSITAVAPAIANAIEDAIGVRIQDLPITAEKIYNALRDREGSA